LYVLRGRHHRDRLIFKEILDISPLQILVKINFWEFWRKNI